MLPVSPLESALIAAVVDAVYDVTYRLAAGQSVPQSVVESVERMALAVMEHAPARKALLVKAKFDAIADFSRPVPIFAECVSVFMPGDLEYEEETQ